MGTNTQQRILRIQQSIVVWIHSALSWLFRPDPRRPYEELSEHD